MEIMVISKSAFRTIVRCGYCMRKYWAITIAKTIAPAGIVFLYIPEKSALKYSFVRMRHRCTGERSTPINPDAKARDTRDGRAGSPMLISRGKVLPTNPTVLPVRSPASSSPYPL